MSFSTLAQPLTSSGSSASPHPEIYRVSLLQEEFAVDDDTGFLCWFLRVEFPTGVVRFFFIAEEITTFFGYANTTQAIQVNVDPDEQRTWAELKMLYRIDKFETPSNWHPDTVFISESGLYSLAMKSTKPEAKPFQRWVCDEILPSLRQTGRYSAVREENERERELQEMIMNLSQQLADANLEPARANERHRQDMTLATEHSAIANQNIVKQSRVVVALPDADDKRHLLVVHRLEPDVDNWLQFTRLQACSLEVGFEEIAKKHPRAEEIYRRDRVSNAVDVLNCLKERLRKLGRKYDAKSNKIQVHDLSVDEVLTLVRKIVSKTKYCAPPAATESIEQ